MTEQASEPGDIESLAQRENVLQQQLDNAFERRAEAAVREDGIRAAALASNAERDAATMILSDAYAQGRITADELSLRTTQALAARTHGDLAGVLEGLTPAAPVSERPHPVRLVVFLMMTVMTSPFLIVGAGFLFFGSDLGDRVFGVILLALLLPGLVGMYRWAIPRGSRLGSS